MQKATHMLLGQFALWIKASAMKKNNVRPLLSLLVKLLVTEYSCTQHVYNLYYGTLSVQL